MTLPAANLPVTTGRRVLGTFCDWFEANAAGCTAFGAAGGGRLPEGAGAVAAARTACPPGPTAGLALTTAGKRVGCIEFVIGATTG